MPASMLISRFAERFENTQIARMRASINKAGKLLTHSINALGLSAALAHTKHCRLGKSRLYGDERVCGWFDGFLIDQPEIPWGEIFDGLERGNYQIFRSFKAPFALAAHFYKSGDTFFVSDMCSQIPAYYCLREGKLFLSTSFATFFDCLNDVRFNPKWLTDFILFNFPLDQTTPIIDVHRMPAASVMRMEAHGVKPLFTTYADVYHAEAPQCSDKEMKERTYDLFQQRFSKYYTSLSEGSYAASITAGFDSRLCVLFAPPNIDLHLYTYGMPDCADVGMGKLIAHKLGLPHHDLSFKDDLISSLYSLAETTVDYTGGTLNIMRSTLLSVYEQLADLGMETVVTGIVGDHFFRSSGSPGGNLSIAAVELFQDPAHKLDKNPFWGVFKDKQVAMEHFLEARASLEQRFAWSAIPLAERHLTYAMYELSPKYFGGEAALAGHYVAVASPFWDADVRKNAYNSTLSTMTSTKYIHKSYPHWKKHSLFAYILMQHPQFKKIPIHGLSPKYYAAGDKYSFYWGKVLQRGLPKLWHRFFPAKEDQQEQWDTWLGKYLLSPLVQKPDALRVSEYIDPAELQKIIASETGEGARGSNYFIGGKLVTAELLLRKFS